MTLGTTWDWLRFALIFLFLLGNRGLSLPDGNFVILLLGISGQPALTYLWTGARSRLLRKEPGRSGILAAARLPGLLVEGLGILGFFLGRLPGQGQTLLMDNRVFPAGAGVFLLLFLFLMDLFFEIFLITPVSHKEN